MTDSQCMGRLLTRQGIVLLLGYNAKSSQHIKRIQIILAKRLLTGDK